MTVHIDDHRIRLVECCRARIEGGDDRIAAVIFGICLRCTRCIVLRERLCLRDLRCRRRLGHGRIGIVRLSRRRVVAQTVCLRKGAGDGRGRQTFADLDLQGEIVAICRCILVEEFVRKSFYHGGREVLLDRCA